MKETNGGIIPLLLAAYIVSDVACAALAVGIYNGYKDAKAAAKK